MGRMTKEAKPMVMMQVAPNSSKPACSSTYPVKEVHCCVSFHSVHDNVHKTCMHAKHSNKVCVDRAACCSWCPCNRVRVPRWFVLCRRVRHMQHCIVWLWCSTWQQQTAGVACQHQTVLSEVVYMACLPTMMHCFDTLDLIG